MGPTNVKIKDSVFTGGEGQDGPPGNNGDDVIYLTASELAGTMMYTKVPVRKNQGAKKALRFPSSFSKDKFSRFFNENGDEINDPIVLPLRPAKEVIL